jgi:hypothetical protein
VDSAVAAATVVAVVADTAAVVAAVVGASPAGSFYSVLYSGQVIALRASVKEARMVHLYNRLGDCLSFSTAGWKEVLDNAGAHGWKGMGTIRPPAEFLLDLPCSETVTWDGNYTRPLGQTVSPDDALALSAAIDRALTLGADWNVNRRARLRAFSSFCHQRGFLVSSNHPPVMEPAIPYKTRYKLAS